MIEERAPPQSQTHQSPIPSSPNHAGAGAILEGAFVDPAYSWPPPDGAGANALEIVSKTTGSTEQDDDLAYPEVPKIKARRKVITETEIVTTGRCGGFLKCCRSEEAVVKTHTETIPEDLEEKQRLRAEYLQKRDMVKKKRREWKLKKVEEGKYNTVPEGVLVYRLDTAQKTVTLVSAPNSNTDMKNLMTEMRVVDAAPSKASNRRGILLTGDNGETVEIVACEQRTATSWMEALNMVLGKKSKSMRKFFSKNKKERKEIEEQYLNLTAYSNKLIRTGAIPSHKGKNKTTGGIYYHVAQNEIHGEELHDEELESIAKRRAVIKDSWDFYRMICSLLRDRRKFDETFRKLQMDPVYPYLNSMTGLNDPGDDAQVMEEVMQKDLPEYAQMSRTAVCKDLVRKAEEALPSLVEICKALAGSLGMEEVGVGPVKEVSSAIRKAEKKYEGDVLKVKDYCRALLVVKDLPTLLALLELARDSFGPLIRRVKLSTLKSDHESLAGGYRDCKINIELKNHICEIQVHVWPMYVICGVDGFRHYRHCLEYSTDSFDDPYDALANLDHKTLAELIVMAEEAVAGMPLDNLQWYHEKYILDYFAEVGLFLDHHIPLWAETTLRHLIKLRCESPDIGADHIETQYLYRYLEKALRLQNKKEEADEIKERLANVEISRKKEKENTTKSLWDAVFTDPSEAFEIIMDPNKKEREEETRLKKQVKASKKAWRKIREQRFKFLDGNNDLTVGTVSTK
mmetsp:Transcript_16796/g.25138  ORF Transcript_16796/g.25138 Transcript_16796/m.25138 type:complete len:741 (-) Transcript_16796:252-2474(-)